MTVVGKAARFYDPRFDSTVGGSGSLRAADQTTWAWAPGGTEIGRSPALALLFYLIGWRINGLLAVGRGVPIDRIDLDSFMTAANLCDEAVLKADGSYEPRYRCDGLFSEADDPKQVIASLEATMNGKLRDRGGKLALQVFHNDLAYPVIDFTADDVLGAFTWTPGQSLEARKNIARGRYTDPSDASLYQLIDYPAVSIANLDGIDRSDPVDYALVQSPSQAQRLAKQRLQRSLFPGTFSADFNAKGWAVEDGQVVRLTFPALNFVNRPFRVEAGTIQPTGVCPLVLREEYAQIYAWDHEERPAVVGATPIVRDPMNDPLIAGIEEAGTTALWTEVLNEDGTSTADAIQLALEAAATSTDLDAANATIASLTSDLADANDALATITSRINDYDGSGPIP